MGMVLKHYLWFSSAIIAVVCIVLLPEEIPIDPDVKKNVSELILSKGYPVEEHTVLTDDGYILSIQRIPRGRLEPVEDSLKMPNKTVVLVMHGIASSSADWVWNFPNQSLGFILADEGFDVWLGNIRGNAYGQQHVKYSVNSKEFWKFTWDEMARFDLKCTTDYILLHTGAKQIRYVGFSMGVSIVMALLSDQPSYQNKIHSVVALAPAVYVKHFNTQIRHLVLLLTSASNALGIDTFGIFDNTSTGRNVADGLCKHKAGRLICEQVLPLIVGTPSVQQFNKDTAPEYHFENVNTPVAVIWGKNDQMVPTSDVKKFRDRLKNVFALKEVEDPEFSHMDFVWGIEAPKYVYSYIIKWLHFERTTVTQIHN